MKLKPKAGLVVRDPDTRQQLAPEGEEKPLSQYWMRRLADGDVVEVQSVAAPVAQPTPTKKGDKQS